MKKGYVLTKRNNNEIFLQDNEKQPAVSLPQAVVKFNLISFQ